jgi:hypothetical protein
MLSIFTFSILAYKISAWINSWLKNLVESRILRFDSTTRFCQRKIDPTPNPDSDYLGTNDLNSRPRLPRPLLLRPLCRSEREGQQVARTGSLVMVAAHRAVGPSGRQNKGTSGAVQEGLLSNFGGEEDD